MCVCMCVVQDSASPISNAKDSRAVRSDCPLVAALGLGTVAHETPLPSALVFSSSLLCSPSGLYFFFFNFSFLRPTTHAKVSNCGVCGRQEGPVIMTAASKAASYRKVALPSQGGWLELVFLSSSCFFLFFFFLPFLFFIFLKNFILFNFTILYWFCHISK